MQHRFGGLSFFLLISFLGWKVLYPKKYTKTNGKDSKHTNSIHMSII